MSDLPHDDDQVSASTGEAIASGLSKAAEGFKDYVTESVEHLARIPSDVDKAIAEGALGKVSRDYLSDVNRLHEGEMDKAELVNFVAGHLTVSVAKGAPLIEQADRVGKAISLPVEHEALPEAPAYDLPPHATVHAGMVEARLNGHAWEDIHSHLDEHRAAGITSAQMGMKASDAFLDRTQAVTRRAMVESNVNQSTQRSGIPEMALANIPIKSNRDVLIQPTDDFHDTMPRATAPMYEQMSRPLGTPAKLIEE